MKKLILTAGLFAAAMGATTIVATGAAAIYACTRNRNHGRFRRGQVAIITGGSSGLGLALAHRFGRAGLRLVLAARSQEQLEEAKRELLASGSIASEKDVLIVSCDLTDQKQAAKLIDTTLQVFGTLDVLINNAGVIEVGPVENQPFEAYERAMAINFFGAVYTTYAALPTLLEKKESAIVNISSIGGKMGVPHPNCYIYRELSLRGSPSDHLLWMDSIQYCQDNLATSFRSESVSSFGHMCGTRSHSVGELHTYEAIRTSETC